MSQDRLTDQDHDLIVRYAHRELDEAARLDVERRLATDEEFATAFEDFLEVDLVSEYLATQRQPTRTGLPIRGLALAAAVIVAIAAWAWFGGEPQKSIRLAIVPTPPTEELAEYAEGIGVPEPRRVPASAMRSVDPNLPAVKPRTVEEFLRVVEDAERKRAEESLRAATNRATGRFVTLRFLAESDCSAVVIQLDTTGTLRRRFPAPEGVFVFGEADNRFAAGKTHVLPRPVVIANPHRPDRVAAHPGFDVPSDLDDPRIWLMLCVRDEPVTDALLAEIDAKLATSPDGEFEPTAERIDAARASLSEWLAERGFSVGTATASAN